MIAADSFLNESPSALGTRTEVSNGERESLASINKMFLFLLKPHPASPPSASCVADDYTILMDNSSTKKYFLDFLTYYT